MGSTRPSPSVPRPVPSFQPIILSSLFPTLLPSSPGLACAGAGAGSTTLSVSAAFAGSGMSGWLNSTRLSDARSRYRGALAAFFCRAVSRSAAFFRFVYSAEHSSSQNARERWGGARLVQIRLVIMPPQLLERLELPRAEKACGRGRIRQLELVGLDWNNWSRILETEKP